MIYVLRVKLNTCDVFKLFQQHNEHENNRVCRFRIDWKKKYFNDEFDDHRFEYDIEWKLIVSKTSKQNEVVERLKQIFMFMINILLKNVDLNDKWWIELIKTINYLQNRFLMINRLIIFYKIDIKKNHFLFILIESKQWAMLWNENRLRNKKNLLSNRSSLCW
jgi:hypothetical protein